MAQQAEPTWDDLNPKLGKPAATSFPSAETAAEAETKDAKPAAEAVVGGSPFEAQFSRGTIDQRLDVLEALIKERPTRDETEVIIRTVLREELPRFLVARSPTGAERQLTPTTSGFNLAPGEVIVAIDGRPVVRTTASPQGVTYAAGDQVVQVDTVGCRNCGRPVRGYVRSTR